MKIWLAIFFSVLSLTSVRADGITFATDWKAQAEHGGFYQALANGYYQAEGLKVTIRPGGPGSDNPRLLAAGALDIAIASNSFQPINMLSAGVDVKVVMASFQKDPQILMLHPDDPADSFDQLQGRPIFISDAAIAAFWPWMKSKFGYKDQQIRKYTYSLAPWLVNKGTVQEGYVSSEPFSARQAGITPKVLLFADAGYPGYSGMVMVNNSYLKDNRQTVTAFVRASIKGWIDYLYGDPAPANKLILHDNPEMTPELLSFAINEIRSRGIAGDKETLGSMSVTRWETFYKEMSNLGAVEKGVNVNNLLVPDLVPGLIHD
ncbi:ABC transporter substrate-binding protein [Kordiimonas sediminis]|uniref:ABC transporter substrate-binding protein n=1 Tax=Kordiimonas sediminis TaxID=1735581 RepID=A0A919E9N1_9PROT|nr:ABC transporter substrate-binding protein [Kordiimonas sediminis]GHF27777.1 ABC transporter substrate-binding protein [Kordiimonas sediminis]